MTNRDVVSEMISLLDFNELIQVKEFILNEVQQVMITIEDHPNIAFIGHDVQDVVNRIIDYLSES